MPDFSSFALLFYHKSTRVVELIPRCVLGNGFIIQDALSFKAVEYIVLKITIVDLLWKYIYLA